MRKSKEKILFEGVIPVNNGNTISLVNADGEVELEDLIGRIMELTALYSDLKVEVKDYAPKTVTRAPIYKYICPSCGKEIKTTVEDLQAICKECDKVFVEKE